MNTERRAPGLSDVFHHDVSGMRVYGRALLLFMALFAALLGAGTYCVMKAVPLGAYAATQIDRQFYVIVLAWLVFSLVLALAAVKASAVVSYHIAGPIKRMERLLDRMIAREHVKIVLREGDALAGVADKINRIMERDKKDHDEQ